MRQFYINTLFILLILQNSIFLFGQDIDVLWVHGLDGHTNDSDKSIWAKRYAKDFEKSRKMKSTVADYRYTYRSGVKDFADHVFNDVDIPTPKKAIIVGHSMGGMVARYVDINQRYYNKEIKGIITVGSPLKGAEIIKREKATAFMVNFFYHSIRGPMSLLTPNITEIIKNIKTNHSVGQGLSTLGYNPYNNAWVSEKLIRLGLRIFGMEVLCGILVPEGLKWLFIESIDKPPSSSTNNPRKDLSPGSEHINSFDNAYSSTPKIHIWGNEHTPVSYRSIFVNANGYSESGYYDFFRAMGIVYSVVGVGLLAGVAWYNPTAFYWAYEFNEGFKFLAGDKGELAWNGTVIGATKIVKRSFTRFIKEEVKTCFTYNRYESSWACSKWGWFGWFCKAITWVISVVDCFIDIIWRAIVIEWDDIQITRSDGIVTEASQKGEGQAWSSNAKFIEAIGVNHREYGNHPEMDKIFNAIWDGDETQLGVRIDKEFRIKERK